MRLEISPSSQNRISSVPSSSLSESCIKRHPTHLRRRLSVRGISNSPNLFRSQSVAGPVPTHRPIKRSCSASLSDDFGAKYDEGDMRNNSTCTMPTTCSTKCRDSISSSKMDFMEPMMFGIQPEAPDWPERSAVMWVNLEQKANRLDLPLSLRMIKKKQRWRENFRDLAYSDSDPSTSSIQKAFSSMVSIVLELQYHALQTKKAVRYEELKKEMHASYFWLFQQVFSPTPALMISVMTLLADFSSYSMACNVGISEEPPLMGNSKVDSSKNTPILSPEVENCRVFDDHELRNHEELSLWNSIVDEAEKMEGLSIDREAKMGLISPVTVMIEEDDYMDYYKTDMFYQMGLSEEPCNPLLLCNYAQFLHLVLHDYDRAEECFKRAVQVEPPDAESLSLYANFLWIVRADSWGAEEKYLQAMAADPNNSYHAAKYASFLWNTGGEETCFPLNNTSSQSTINEASNL